MTWWHATNPKIFPTLGLDLAILTLKSKCHHSQLEHSSQLECFWGVLGWRWNNPLAPVKFSLDVVRMAVPFLKLLCVEFLSVLHKDTSLNMSLEWQLRHLLLSLQVSPFDHGQAPSLAVPEKENHFNIFFLLFYIYFLILLCLLMFLRWHVPPDASATSVLPSIIITAQNMKSAVLHTNIFQQIPQFLSHTWQ